MNCRNCGAPMTLIRERDYYHCEYCGSFYFPASTPDGVRLLGDNPDGIQCPVCGIVLQMATFDDHYRGYRCARCKGLLFTRSTFRQLVESRRARATTPPEPLMRHNEPELRRTVQCPICARAMDTFPYMGPGAIVVDTCSHCDVIWLDYRELDRAVNAPGKDRGKARQEEERREEELLRKQGQQPPKKKRKAGIDLLDLLGG